MSLDAVRSAAAYWIRQGWLAADFSRMLERRRPRPDRSRALSRGDVEQLFGRKDISIRERVMWRLLYETAARSAELLALDVEDLDLPNRRAKVRRKGGAVDIIVWQTGTARLLPRLLKGRTSGPVFVTARKARVQLPAADLDEHGHARLSYQQAEALFTKASGGATLHQLRHSALTHDAEAGTGTPMLMARSGHTSRRLLAKYARVSAEALARHQAERDPGLGGEPGPRSDAAGRSARPHGRGLPGTPGRGRRTGTCPPGSLACSPGRALGKASSVSPGQSRWPALPAA